MTIRHTEEKNRFDLYGEAGEHIGEIAYMPGGGKELFATHTEVFPEYEGKGHAASLLDALADYARKEGAKIVPICPYVIAAFRKFPEKYADVMK